MPVISWLSSDKYLLIVCVCDNKYVLKQIVLRGLSDAWLCYHAINQIVWSSLQNYLFYLFLYALNFYNLLHFA